jgi:hypothetical protein
VRLGRRARTRGFPPSGNGASSLHLAWRFPSGAGHLVDAAVTLQVTQPPVIDHLYFWALQVGFPGSGAAHLGLQWNRAFPGFGAANWGGYAVDGSLLRGTESTLPSTPGDPNTRDYPWEPRHAYRLRVQRAGDGLWRGEVTDLSTRLATTVRELMAPSPFLTDVIVWSEVFARCDDPSVTARWSDFVAVDERGEPIEPVALVANYQSPAAGGCANTTSALDDQDGAVQITNSERVTPQGAVLPLAN